MLASSLSDLTALKKRTLFVISWHSAKSEFQRSLFRVVDFCRFVYISVYFRRFRAASLKRALSETCRVDWWKFQRTNFHKKSTTGQYSNWRCSPHHYGEREILSASVRPHMFELLFWIIHFDQFTNRFWMCQIWLGFYIRSNEWCILNRIGSRHGIRWLRFGDCVGLPPRLSTAQWCRDISAFLFGSISQSLNTNWHGITYIMNDCGEYPICVSTKSLPGLSASVVEDSVIWCGSGLLSIMLQWLYSRWNVSMDMPSECIHAFWKWWNLQTHRWMLGRYSCNVYARGPAGWGAHRVQNSLSSVDSCLCRRLGTKSDTNLTEPAHFVLILVVFCIAFVLICFNHLSIYGVHLPVIITLCWQFSRNVTRTSTRTSASSHICSFSSAPGSSHNVHLHCLAELILLSSDGSSWVVEESTVLSNHYLLAALKLQLFCICRFTKDYKTLHNQ